ncbi:1-acyl-sn-glycerol-3-phosphate acyltransferase [Aestuarium zhoushanense]|nr:1-acyl-sn-glycerol-3-phosphate acyltransferase [Aestuarium zhoushanense]
MITNWSPELPTPDIKITPLGWLRFAIKAPLIGILVFGGLFVLLLVRLVERPLCGMDRPVTPFITLFVCRNTLRLIGIDYRVIGEPMKGPGAVVANHVSWMDIFILNARKRIYFVSKAEVANWPGIGWLARATGTVFIRRDRKDAKAQITQFQERISHGHKLLFFPEGTSTDGRVLLPFKPTLFAAFLADEMRETLSIQPVTMVYRSAEGADIRQYGWWGNMDFGHHFLAVLTAPKQGSVTVVYHDPVKVADYSDRKALARDLEVIVRKPLAEAGILDA